LSLRPIDHRYEDRIRSHVFLCMLAYYVEWQPTRINDREPFMEGLLRDVGPSAVEEYIAAVAHTQGDGSASALRTWWALRQAQDERPD